ncbi:MAG: hypothetical protein K6E29_03915 [Cyanobacteria bacterium RUI128]|nr:hypothetical protein [Cyanobacteria bacterium RUI128]
MSISLNTDQYHLMTKLNITTSRMHDYADKSVDEIIDAEAESGNALAKDYGRKLFGNPDELIETFQLADPTNKYNILNQMSTEQREKVLELLDSEDMVVGLNFFTQEKLAQMLGKVSVAESASVALEAFSLPQIIAMMPEEELESFFMSSEIPKESFTAQLRNLDPELLIQMTEGITGQAADQSDASKLIAQIMALPDKQFKETMASLDPEIQQNVVFQMASEDKGVLLHFSGQSFNDMVSGLQKPDMVKSMIALDTSSLQRMTKQLPEDLFSIVATQVDTRQFAQLLIDRCPELLEKFTSMANASTTH